MSCHCYNLTCWAPRSVQIKRGTSSVSDVCDGSIDGDIAVSEWEYACVTSDSTTFPVFTCRLLFNIAVIVIFYGDQSIARYGDTTLGDVQLLYIFQIEDLAGKKFVSPYQILRVTYL